jgi:hypothetical protein
VPILWPCGLRRTTVGRSIAGMAGSKPAEGMNFHLLCLLGVVYIAASATGWSLVQVRPTECVCMCVCLCE